MQEFYNSLWRVLNLPDFIRFFITVFMTYFFMAPKSSAEKKKPNDEATFVYFLRKNRRKLCIEVYTFTTSDIANTPTDLDVENRII